MVSSGEIAGCCSGWKMLTRLNKYIRLKFFTRYLRLRTDWQLVYNYRIPIPHSEAVKLFLAALFISFFISLLIALFLVLIAALFTALFVTPYRRSVTLRNTSGLDVLWEILAVEWNIFIFAELDLPLVKLMFLAPDIVSHWEAALPRTRNRKRTQRKTWEVLDW